jgi:hypothetical protein
MTKRFTLLAAQAAMPIASTARAQYLNLDAVDNRVVDNYQSASCQQL